jgi:hypothetical protein
MNTIQDCTGSRKSDDYTKDRFDWLDQVAADPKLPASAFKVSYAIATSLWRNKGTVTLVTPDTKESDNVREAWIGTRDLADMISMSRFTVMNMVDRLKERGHLEFDPGKQGRGHANHYRLVRKGEPAKARKTKIKGAHSSLLAATKAKTKGEPTHLLDDGKGAPANLLDAVKGEPTHQIPLIPSEEVPSEERGAPKARPRRAPSELRVSSKEVPQNKIDIGDVETGALDAPPRRPIVVQIDDIQGGRIIDTDGVEYIPPPDKRRPPPRPKSNVDRGRDMLKGILQ